MSLSNAFASPRRVRAAVFSMHQFCPAIRSMFRDDEIDDPAIEAMTVYLYMHHARGIFGRFFAMRLLRKMRNQVKYCSGPEVVDRMKRITRRARKIERHLRTKACNRLSGAERHAMHLQSVVRALMYESDHFRLDKNACDAAFQHAVAPFQAANARMQSHLEGIRRQHFSML